MAEGALEIGVKPLKRLIVAGRISFIRRLPLGHLQESIEHIRAESIYEHMRRFRRSIGIR